MKFGIFYFAMGCLFQMLALLNIAQAQRNEHHKELMEAKQAQLSALQRLNDCYDQRKGDLMGGTR